MSRNNIANALAGAAAALGLGVPRSAVVEGLRTFAPDPEHNWGRLNTYSLPLPSGGKATVIMDMAHNEAGLEALLDVARGLAAPGGAVRLGLGCAGDRADEAIIAMGEIAGQGAEEVALKVARTTCAVASAEDLLGLFREGLAKVGVLDVPGYETELEAFEALVPHALDGDVVALMCHAERAEVDGWIREHGGKVDDARSIRRKVVAARGEHELEARSRPCGRRTTSRPGSPRPSSSSTVTPATRAWSSSWLAPRTRWATSRAPSVCTRRLWPAGCASRTGTAPSSSSRRACASWGAPPRRRASSPTCSRRGPHNTAALMLRALVQADLGQERQAVADLIRATLEATTDVDTQAYRRALRAYADELAATRATAGPWRRPRPDGTRVGAGHSPWRCRTAAHDPVPKRTSVRGVVDRLGGRSVGNAPRPRPRPRRPRPRPSRCRVLGSRSGSLVADAGVPMRAPAWACLVALLELGDDERVLVDAHDDEVARVGAGQHVPHGVELVEDDLDLAAARALLPSRLRRPRR